MKKMLLNNWGLKLLSFILAIVLWLVVANIENPVTTKQFKDVKVKVINESVINSINKVYEIKSGQTASFTVKGRRSVLDNLTADDFNVIADLSHLSEVNAVQVEISAKNAEQDIELLKNNNTLTVSLEDEKEASFSVTVVTKGEPAKGYALGEKEVTPNIVDVSGPKSLINKIKEVRVVADVTNVRKDITKHCKLQYYNGDGDLLDDARISCEDKSARVSIQVLRTKEVSVSVNTRGTPAKGYSMESLNFEPQTVTIAGTDDVLDQINQITINDVDISGLSEDKEYSFKLEDYVSRNVVLTDTEQKIMVTVKIGQIETKVMKLKAGDINIDGGIPTYNYVIDKDAAVEVVLTGYKDQLKKLTADDLKAVIAVNGLSPGSYLLSVSVAEMQNIKTAISGKVRVQVKKAK